jgi:hypothetical protein
MNSRKKTRLYEILEGTSDLSSPLIERSSLVAVAERPRPELPSPRSAWATGVPLVILLSTLAFLGQDHLVEPLHRAAAISVIVSVLVGVILWSRAGRSHIDAFAESLDVPMRELDDILNYLQSYQIDLDRRTSRYFHCVTNTKVTSYFVLSQLIMALRNRVDEVQALLEVPNRENLLVAHESLAGNLVFRDSLSQTHGNVHVVPLARLKVTVVQLIEFIDQEINLLERELDLDTQEFEREKERPH